jgi:hypothetical protein
MHHGTTAPPDPSPSKKIGRTVHALLRVVTGHTMSIVMAMQYFGGFTAIEKKDRRLEQKVRREFKKAQAEKRMDAELEQQMVDMSIDVDNDMDDIKPISADSTNTTIVCFESSCNTISDKDKQELGMKKAYRTPNQVETDAINKAIVQRRKGNMMAEATEMFFAEKQKKASTSTSRKIIKIKSAQRIVEEMKAKYGVHLHDKYVRVYVAKGVVGKEMLKTGAPGRISELAFKALENAYVSLIKL